MDVVPQRLDPEAIGKLIRYWVYYDNKIKELTDENRKLRSTKEAYEQQVLQYLKASGMANPIIQIGDGRIVVAEDKHQQALSYSMLETTLTKYYALRPGSKNETKDILAFLRAQRTVQSTPCLKRIMNPSSRSRSASRSRSNSTTTTTTNTHTTTHTPGTDGKAT
jgi:hypothetical protein